MPLLWSVTSSRTNKLERFESPTRFAFERLISIGPPSGIASQAFVTRCDNNEENLVRSIST